MMFAHRALLVSRKAEPALYAAVQGFAKEGIDVRYVAPVPPYNFVDLALAGAYADQQEFYRPGLAALDAHSNATFKESFLYLKPAQQDAVIGALEEGKATGFSWPTAQALFNTLRTHIMEGMFSDPIYGGNRDFVGWKLVGFPGAQRLYTTADMSGKEAFNRATIGLQAVAKTTNRRG